MKTLTIKDLEKPIAQPLNEFEATTSDGYKLSIWRDNNAPEPHERDEGLVPVLIDSGDYTQGYGRIPCLLKMVRYYARNNMNMTKVKMLTDEFESGSMIFDIDIYEKVCNEINVVTKRYKRYGHDCLAVLTPDFWNKHIDNNTPIDREKALKYCNGVIDVMTEWIEGNVYAFTVESPDGDEDSRGGYYGDDFEDNRLLEAANGMIEQMRASKKSEPLDLRTLRIGDKVVTKEKGTFVVYSLSVETLNAEFINVNDDRYITDGTYVSYNRDYDIVRIEKAEY